MIIKKNFFFRVDLKEVLLNYHLAFNLNDMTDKVEWALQTIYYAKFDIHIQFPKPPTFHATLLTPQNNNKKVEILLQLTVLVSEDYMHFLNHFFHARQKKKKITPSKKKKKNQQKNSFFHTVATLNIFPILRPLLTQVCVSLLGATGLRFTHGLCLPVVLESGIALFYPDQ